MYNSHLILIEIRGCAVGVYLLNLARMSGYIDGGKRPQIKNGRWCRVSAPLQKNINIKFIARVTQPPSEPATNYAGQTADALQWDKSAPAEWHFF